MSELEVITGELVTTPTLDELADTIRTETALMESDLVSAVGHAIAIGGALAAARAQVSAGDWIRWLGENTTMSRQMAGRCVRLHAYQATIPTEAFEPYVSSDGRTIQPTTTHAFRMLRGMPDTNPKGRPSMYGADVRVEAVRLRNEGWEYRDIGELLGVSSSTAQWWSDPAAATRNAAKSKAKRRQAALATKALAAQQERDDRDRLARQQGGDISVAYGLIRKALLAADKAGCADAVTALHRAEDAVAAMLRELRQA